MRMCALPGPRRPDSSLVDLFREGAGGQAAAQAAEAPLGQARRAQEALTEIVERHDDYESVRAFEPIKVYLRREPDALERAALARGLGALVAVVGAGGGFFFLPTAMVS